MATRRTRSKKRRLNHLLSNDVGANPVESQPKRRRLANSKPRTVNKRKSRQLNLEKGKSCKSKSRHYVDWETLLSKDGLQLIKKDKDFNDYYVDREEWRDIFENDQFDREGVEIDLSKYKLRKLVKKRVFRGKISNGEYLVIWPNGEYRVLHTTNRKEAGVEWRKIKGIHAAFSTAALCRYPFRFSYKQRSFSKCSRSKIT